MRRRATRLASFGLVRGYAAITALLCAVASGPGACLPPDDGGGGAPPEEPRYGIQIQHLSLAPADEGCFQGQLAYEILPARGAARFEVEYDWDHALYQVTGLQKRSVSQRQLSRIEETFQVCPKHPAPGVQLFTFGVDARSPRDWFFGKYTANHVIGSERWAGELLPEVDALWAKIQAGDRTPTTLRRYHRARAAYVYGGYDAFEQAMDADVAAWLSEFQVPPPASVLDAFKQLVKENGNRLEVGFETDSGEVSYLYLNEAFELDGDPVPAAHVALTTGAIAELLGLEAGDDLRPGDIDQVPAGVSIQFHRYRDGVPVMSDMVSALVVRNGERYHLEKLEVSLGRLGRVTCPSGDDNPPGGARPSSSGDTRDVITTGDPVASHAIPDEPPFSDVTDSRVLFRRGLDYHCAHVWNATWTDPEGDGDYPYFRIVDVGTGEVYHDGKLVMDDTPNDLSTDVHRVKTGITIPYKIVANGIGPYFQEHTTVPGGVLHAFDGEPEEWFDGQVRYRAVDQGSASLPAAPDVPYVVPAAFLPGENHQRYRYVPYWENDIPGPFQFLVEGLYSRKFDDAYSSEFIHHPTSGWNENELVYPPTWITQLQWESPSTECPAGLQPDYLPTEFDFGFPFPRHCASRINRARAFVGQAYFYAQYARYLWSRNDFGVPIWSGGPDTNDGSDRYVRLDVVSGKTGESRSCGRWNGARRVFMYIDRRVGDDESDDDWHDLECSINRSVSTFPHEFGHWVGNVIAFNQCQTSAGAAKVEAFADYISDSLNANWRSHRIKSRAGNSHLTNWQFKSGKGSNYRYHGNTLYAQLLDDHLYREGADCLAHKQHSIKVNTINWSGMWVQHMNLVGGMFSDPTVRHALRRTAGPPIGGKSWQARVDTSCSGDFSLNCLTHAAHRVSGEMYGWDTSHYPAGNIMSVNEEVVVNQRDVEIQKAAKQHDWHRYLKQSSTRRQTHKVSKAPSHAHSLTLTENAPAIVNVRFDGQFHTKWVNFFAHAGVKYKLNVISSAATVARLFDVVEQDNHGEVSSGLLQRAANQDCPALPHSFNSGLIPVRVEENLGYCENPPNQSESMLTFTPYRSGWLYASVSSTEKALGVIKLATADGSIQITSNTRLATNQAFDRDAELRFGQVVPVTIEHQPDTTKNVNLFRRGLFVQAPEEHFWKFQPKAFHVIPGFDQGEPWHRWSEKQRNALLQSTLNANKQFIVLVDRLNTSSEYELEAFMSDESGASSSLVPLPAHVISGPVSTSSGLIASLEWTIDAAALEKLATENLGHHVNDLRNVYLVLRRVPGPAGPPIRLNPVLPEPYVLKVISRSNFKIGTSAYPNIEGDSSIINPLVLRRRCTSSSYENQNVTKLEKNFEHYAVSERLSHGDADYFLVWLQEGEHMNVTYRGDIPAIIDVGGAQREVDLPTTTPNLLQYESELNYIWDTWLADPQKESKVALRNHPSLNRWLATGWRPAIWSNEGLCKDNYQYDNCANQYFAQRGYLWTMNEELSGSNSVAITDDNAIHLTFTAYITAPYIVRVRGQGNELPEPDGNLAGVWTQRYRDILNLGTGNGYPYTLNVSFGVHPNRLRPHWQYLDPGENPARVLSCQR